MRSFLKSASLFLRCEKEEKEARALGYSMDCIIDTGSAYSVFS